MARQAGPLFFTGTIGDVIFYKLGENYYARMKGSYNTKALQKPGARPLMQLRQKEFGRASQLASQVHRGLPLKERSKALYNALTKQARQLLRAGKDEEAIIELLKQSLKPKVKATKAPATIATPIVKTQQIPQSKQTRGTTSLEKPVETLMHRAKQARWKVKSNGWLHATKRPTLAYLPSSIPIACHPELVSRSDDSYRKLTVTNNATSAIPSP